MKKPLATVLEIKREKLNQIDKLIDTITKENEKKAKSALIGMLKKELETHINFQTICFMNMNGLNPLPAYVLPPTATYSWRTIDPTYDPIDPINRLF